MVHCHGLSSFIKESADAKGALGLYLLAFPEYIAGLTISKIDFWDGNNSLGGLMA
jgi:hypothetical protein